MEGQMSIFDYSFEDSIPKELSNYKIRNKVRLIELFAGKEDVYKGISDKEQPYEN